jgi:hypothetical protein
MNNKGFNWFFPVMILALILFFGTSIFMSANKKEISEEKFITMLQEGKVQDVKVFRDNYTADIFLNKKTSKEKLLSIVEYFGKPRAKPKGNAT